MNTHQAKSRLSELIREAEGGAEVIVARGGRPVARIVPWSDPRPHRSPGRWAGRIRYSGDLVDSDPEVLADFEASAQS